MAWKCPQCGCHVRKGGRCPHCNPTVCQICDTSRLVSEIHQHHISYTDNVTIPVCEDCHNKIHNQFGFYDQLRPEMRRSEAKRRGLV